MSKRLQNVIKELRECFILEEHKAQTAAHCKEYGRIDWNGVSESLSAILKAGELFQREEPGLADMQQLEFVRGLQGLLQSMPRKWRSDILQEEWWEQFNVGGNEPQRKRMAKGVDTSERVRQRGQVDGCEGGFEMPSREGVRLIIFGGLLFSAVLLTAMIIVERLLPLGVATRLVFSGALWQGLTLFCSAVAALLMWIVAAVFMTLSSFSLGFCACALKLGRGDLVDKFSDGLIELVKKMILSLPLFGTWWRILERVCLSRGIKFAPQNDGSPLKARP